MARDDLLFFPARTLPVTLLSSDVDEKYDGRQDERLAVADLLINVGRSGFLFKSSANLLHHS